MWEEKATVWGLGGGGGGGGGWLPERGGGGRILVLIFVRRPPRGGDIEDKEREVRASRSQGSRPFMLAFCPILPSPILYGMYCNKGWSAENTTLRKSVGGEGGGGGVPKQGGGGGILVLFFVGRPRTKRISYKGQFIANVQATRYRAS